MKCGRETYAASVTSCGTPTISGSIRPRSTAPDMGCPCAERLPEAGGASSTCIIPFWKRPILEGEYRFQLEGKQEKVLSTGDVFYEAPGSIHLPSASTTTTKSARILSVAFAEKGKEITKLL